MTAAAEPRFTLDEIGRMLRAPTRDHTYLLTRLGPTVRDYLAWKRMSRPAARTVDQIERDLARLCILLPERTVDEISVSDLMLVFEHLPEKSWRRFKAHFNGFFQWAEDFDRTLRNPVRRLPRMKAESAKVYDIFDPTESARVLASATDSLLPRRDLLGGLCFTELGIRKEEGRKLQLEHFDLAGRVVLVTGKGDKERIVPYSDELHIALLDFLNSPIPKVRMRDAGGEYLDEREPCSSDFLFFPSGATGAYKDRLPQLLWTDPTVPMAVSSMHRWWERQVKRAGIRYRSLHMNRHTVGTELVEAEVDSFTIKDWLGHADTRTTEVYVHNARGRLQKAAGKLAGARRRGESDRSE